MQCVCDQISNCHVSYKYISMHGGIVTHNYKHCATDTVVVKHVARECGEVMLLCFRLSSSVWF